MWMWYNTEGLRCFFPKRWCQLYAISLPTLKAANDPGTPPPFPICVVFLGAVSPRTRSLFKEQEFSLARRLWRGYAHCYKVPASLGNKCNAKKIKGPRCVYVCVRKKGHYSEEKNPAPVIKALLCANILGLFSPTLLKRSLILAPIIRTIGLSSWWLWRP